MTSDTPRPRALVFAYACEPGRGSEPGAGWGLVRAIARAAECTVLVGPSHSDAIACWRAANADVSIRFVTVPERTWPGPAGRGRITWFLAYLRWLPEARRIARQLHAEQPFDLAWHATYSVYWLPSPVTELGIPGIWGPVGGAVTTPASLRGLLGPRGGLVEVLDQVAVRTLCAISGAQRTAERATVILAQNEVTRRELPASTQARTRVLNHALFTETTPPLRLQRGRELVVAGALEDRKGVSLVLRAMALIPDGMHLTIHGDGPARGALERLSHELKITHRVRFTGNEPRDELQRAFATAAAVVFTGLREEGGLALAEAMYAGAPVIVLASGGANTIAACTTDTNRVIRIPVTGVTQTAQALADAMAHVVAHPAPSGGPLLDRDAAERVLQKCISAALPHTREVTRPAHTDSRQCAVIMPVFNGEHFIDAAIRSVLRQTHTNLHLVVVDDGSTDDTARIAHELARTDSRLTVIGTDNGGRARARNIGVAAAGEADLLAFIDADDTWDANKLSAQLDELSRHPGAVGVGSFMRYISSTDQVLGLTGQAIDAQDLARVARGELAPFPISSCLVVHRDAFARLAGFDEELREAEDLDFIARLARLGPIACVEYPLGSYRIHPASAMARSRARVNMFARFVRRRLAERDAGRELTWAEFSRVYHPTWRERRRDKIEIWYRSAALWRGEGQPLRAVRYALLAAIAAPTYTLRRALRQRMRTVA